MSSSLTEACLAHLHLSDWSSGPERTNQRRLRLCARGGSFAHVRSPPILIPSPAVTRLGSAAFQVLKVHRVWPAMDEIATPPSLSRCVQYCNSDFTKSKDRIPQEPLKRAASPERRQRHVRRYHPRAVHAIMARMT